MVSNSDSVAQKIGEIENLVEKIETSPYDSVVTLLPWQKKAREFLVKTEEEAKRILKEASESASS